MNVDYLNPGLTDNLTKIDMPIVEGNQGCCIHPNIWHEGVFALSGTQRFFDRQGRVHARVSVDFAREFNCLLRARIE